MRNAVLYFFFPLHKPFGGEVLKDLFAGLIPVKALIFLGYFGDDFHRGMGCHQIDKGQIMPAADFKVVEIMSRCYLHRT